MWVSLKCTKWNMSFHQVSWKCPTRAGCRPESHFYRIIKWEDWELIHYEDVQIECLIEQPIHQLWPVRKQSLSMKIETIFIYEDCEKRAWSYDPLTRIFHDKHVPESRIINVVFIIVIINLYSSVQLIIRIFWVCIIIHIIVIIIIMFTQSYTSVLICVCNLLYISI